MTAEAGGIEASRLRVLVVVGSLRAQSATRTVALQAVALLRGAGMAVDVLDLAVEPLPLLNTDSSFAAPGFAALRERVVKADVLVLCTPDYHGGISGAMKNFLDHFWHEFAGKLFATVVASHEKGLTVHDQIHTVARQCNAWALPYGVSFVDKEDVREGKHLSEALRLRLEMLSGDVGTYGALLAAQRRQDLAGTGAGFLARLRPRAEG